MKRGPSRRTYLAALGTLGAGALAGCTTGNDDAADGPETTSETGSGGTTPQSGTPTSATTTSQTPVEPPAGTSADGVENTTPLVDATQAALVDNDYALEQTVPVSASESTTVRIRSSLDDERNLFVFDAPAETNSIYTADGTRYMRSMADGETNYGTEQLDSFATVHEENDQVSMLDSSEGLGGILNFGNYAPAETVTRNGRRLLRFDLESVDSGSDTSVTSSEGELLVSPESVVFKARAAYTTEESGAQTDWAFVIEELGDVTVEEPDWVETAREQVE